MTPTSQAAEHLSPEIRNAFVDGELSLGERQGLEQHLAECHPCTLHVLAATRLKAATANAGQRFSVPPDALARLTVQLRPQEAPTRTAQIISFPIARWAALAACILLAITLFGWTLLRQPNTMSAELLDQHLAVISSGATPEVISTDRHTVKPWFQGKLPFSFNLPDALPPDTTLRGGDLTYLGGQPAAMLLFTVHKHEVSIFLTQRSSRAAVPGQSGAHSGFVLRYAATQELRIAAVSDVNPADLDLLVTALVQAQSPR